MGERALLVAALVGVSQPASSMTGGVDVELGGPAGPVLAVNPTDPLNIACASEVQLRVSTDGGASWQPPVWADGLTDHDPREASSIAFDGQGRLFWTYYAPLGSVGPAIGGADAFIAQCDPTTGAILPGYPTNLTALAGLPASGGKLCVQPSLAADVSGGIFADALYAVWVTHPGAGQEEYFTTSHSTDQGQTWSSAIQLGNANNAVKIMSSITVGPDGDVYVAAHRQPGFLTPGTPDGISGRVQVFHSSDGGASFTQGQNPYQAGSADITWNAQGQTGAIPGAQFSLVQSIRPWVLADPNNPGRVYVVCADDPDDDVTSGDAADVFLVTSTDHGATWNAPVRIDGGSGTTFQVVPAAAIDPVTGDLVVSYFDNRRGALNANGNYLLDRFLRVSRDGGQTFLGDVQVNDVPFDPDAGAAKGSAGWQMFDVWAASGTEAFAAGYGSGVLRYDGVSWSSEVIAGSPAWYTGIGGSSGSDVFAVGWQGSVFHYDGGSWSAQTSGTSSHLEGVWCSGASDCFVVGRNGTILHYDGNAWSAQASGTVEALLGVWGTGGNDVFAVGYGGTILHYDGVSWTPRVSGTLDVLTDVWGASSTDVFAVGYGGAIFHYDGSVWTPMDGGTGVRLDRVWGSSGSDVFVAGYYGTILHYDGMNWSSLPSGTEQDLRGVWGVSGSDVHVVGQDDLHHYDGVTWTRHLNPTGGSSATTFVGQRTGLAVANGQTSVAWTGNTVDGFGDPLDQQTLFDRFDVTVVDVGELVPPDADRLVLDGAFPNPVATSTSIRYSLPAAGPVRLSLYDVRGHLTARLLDRFESAGRHVVTWNGRVEGRGVPAGVYFLRLEAGGAVDARKVTVFR